LAEQKEMMLKKRMMPMTRVEKPATKMNACVPGPVGVMSEKSSERQSLEEGSSSEVTWFVDSKNLVFCM
jgi:hypothetical protein